MFPFGILFFQPDCFSSTFLPFYLGLFSADTLAFIVSGWISGCFIPTFLPPLITWYYCCTLTGICSGCIYTCLWVCSWYYTVPVVHGSFSTLLCSSLLLLGSSGSIKVSAHQCCGAVAHRHDDIWYDIGYPVSPNLVCEFNTLFTSSSK